MLIEMEESEMEPLTLILENTNGEEVSVEIKPHDNFQMFLDKATSLLGFEIDLNSITDNQPVSLTDNIYEFLMNAEQNESNENVGTDRKQDVDQNTEDLVYVLDDGTQIKASQIQFDNEDTPVDFTAEKIPFVKYADDSDEHEADDSNLTTKTINIVESPVAKLSNQDSSPKCSFINSLPFRLVCNNTSNFEAQFTKYLESSTKNTGSSNEAVANSNNTSFPKKRKDELNLTREDILNMFKDAPVTSVPYEEKSFSDKRKHVRKTDPARLVHKSWNSKPLSCVVDGHSQTCFICRKLVNGNLEKLYLFDNEDQKLHRCSPQRRYSTQLKILCQQCLADNFKPSAMKSPSQSLKPDEYLIIKNNQQYIFQKVTSINLKDCDNLYNEDKEDRTESNTFIDVSDKSVDFVKVEIGSDGEIVTKSLYEEPGSSDDVIIVRDKNNSISSDVEIIEADIDDNVIDIDNLDEADEGVKEFLGKYQCDNNDELKCRFCGQKFEDFNIVIDHGDEHKHETEDGFVFPCPLCDYGYANIKWLKAHMNAAHNKSTSKNNVDNKDGDGKDGHESKDGGETKNSGESKEGLEETSPIHSPVAKRTRSSIKKGDCPKDKETCDERKTEFITEEELNEMKDPHIEIKMEVKQEVMNSSDDEIWILQTGDDDEDRLQEILESVKVKREGEIEVTLHNCATCSQSFTSTTALLEHKCGRRRGRKRKSNVPASSSEDFIKRAQGKFKQVTVNSDLLVERTRKKRNRQPTSDPQIVTCNDCNESFTSKVRLKFHMQFHEPTSFLTSNGEYQCAECDDAQFPTESELFDHVHFQHDKQKRWPCPVKGCGKTFFLRQVSMWL